MSWRRELHRGVERDEEVDGREDQGDRRAPSGRRRNHAREDMTSGVVLHEAVVFDRVAEHYRSHRDVLLRSSA